MSQTVTTSKGAVIRTGQIYTDRRTSNRRTLRVDSIRDTGGGWADVHLAVILVDGKEPARPRTTRMIADRLAGRGFILVEPPTVEPCTCQSGGCDDPWNKGCRMGPPTSDRCDTCGGTGDSSGADWCEECGGTGRASQDDEDTPDDVCPTCGSPECGCPPEIAYHGPPVTDVFLPGDGPARSNPRTVVASA